MQERRFIKVKTIVEIPDWFNDAHVEGVKSLIVPYCYECDEYKDKLFCIIKNHEYLFVCKDCRKKISDN